MPETAPQWKDLTTLEEASPKWKDLTTVDEPEKWTDLTTLEEKPEPEPTRPRSYGVTGDFGPTFIEKIIDFATAGHITYDPEKLRGFKEVTGFEKGKQIPREEIEEPPTAKMGFFEEPTGAPLVAALMGGVGAARAGKGLVDIAKRAGREAVGWFTGGVSEVPRVATTGLKAVAKGVSAKPLEKTMAKAVAKPIGKKAIEVPVKAGVEFVPRAVYPAQVPKPSKKERFYHGSTRTELKGAVARSEFGDYGAGIYVTKDFKLAEGFAKGIYSPKGRQKGAVFEVKFEKPKKIFKADTTPLTQNEITHWVDDGEDMRDIVTRGDLINDLGGRNTPFELKTTSAAWDDFLNKFGYDAVDDGTQIVIRHGKVTSEGKALEVPISEALPKYAQSVNLEKQTLSDSAKRLEVELAGPKKFQSWDQTEALGKKKLESIVETNRVLAKAKKGEGLVAEEMHVIKQVTVNSIDRLAKLEQEFSAGKITEEVFQKEFQLMKDDIWNVVNSPRNELGRAMNYMKKVQEVTDEMGRGLARIEGKMTPRQIEAFAEAVKNKENPVAVSRFLDTIEDPKLVDYVMEFWYNSILSGPPTHVVNIASNAAWSMYQIPHRVHTALWDKIWAGFTGTARTRYINEVIPMMAGYKTGPVKGARSAKDMLRYGQIAEFETKWAQEIGYKAIGAWEKSPNAAIRTAAPFVSAPTRALRAMDVWANSIAYSGEINSIARRLANEKGLKGIARETFETKWKKDLPKWAHEKAMKWAKHNTFMDDPDKFTAWFLGLRKVPVIGSASRFIVPFVNTIGNLTKRGLEFTPGVGIAKEVISRQMGRGLGTPEIIAKQIEGAVLSAYIWYKFDQGDIVGPAPQNEAERERFYAQGKKAWSIRIGDTWIQYRRIEPWNTPIASIAIAREKFRAAKDDTTRTEIFGQVVRGMVNNLIDSSYLQGLSAVFNRYETGKTMPFKFGASFVPYSSLWRSMNRAYEKATEGQVVVREREGWLPALSQVIPFMPKAPGELNVWGEEKVIPGSIFQHWLPYKWSEAISWEKDSVEKAIEVLNKPTDISFYPGLPSQRVTIKGEKVKLDDDIYRKFCIDYGNQAKTKLKVLIEGPLWQRILRNKEERLYPNLIEKMGTKMDTIRDRSRRRAIKEQRIRGIEGG